VDDLRESPAMEIVKQLVSDRIGKVLVVDPHVASLPEIIAGPDGEAALVSSGEALQQADIVVLLVDHSEFKTVDRGALQRKVVVDTRGLWRG
jgi:UDP-N-acetyl-D-mannosaminuronic acid dehydrogenase